jgi:hypothetical protein
MITQDNPLLHVNRLLGSAPDPERVTGEGASYSGMREKVMLFTFFPGDALRPTWYVFFHTILHNGSPNIVLFCAIFFATALNATMLITVNTTSSISGSHLFTNATSLA